MCGIFGKYAVDGITTESLERMARVLVHRGPDDVGFYVNGPVGLGNRRLSIIDIEGGRQPISNEDGTMWIVFNGEIYNYRLLREPVRVAGAPLPNVDRYGGDCPSLRGRRSGMRSASRGHVCLCHLG